RIRDWNLGRLFAREDLRCASARLLVGLQQAWSETDKAACVTKFTPLIDGGKFMASSESNDLRSAIVEECVRRHDHRHGLLLKGLKCLFDPFVRVHIRSLELEAQLFRLFLHRRILGSDVLAASPRQDAEGSGALLAVVRHKLVE